MKAATLTPVNRETESAPFMLSPARVTFGKSGERKIGKGIVAGLVGGLAGTIAMSQFQNAWNKLSKAGNSEVEERTGAHRNPQQDEQPQEREDATMKAAAKLAGFSGRQLSREQKKKLGPVIHYSFGTLQGGFYGASLELLRMHGGLIPGLVFGAALFGLVDELAVPRLGLSPKATESPLSSHLYGLASHLVYGISTEMSRRGIRALL